MKLKVIVPLLIFLISFEIKAQTLPSELLSGWKYAGIQTTDGFLPLSDSNSSYNFVEYFYGDNTGQLDNSQILQNAIDQVEENSTIYFPPGIYLFNDEIIIEKSIRISGRSPNTTMFLFDLKGEDKNLFSIKGKPTSKHISVVNIPQAGNNTVLLADIVDWDPFTYIEIEQSNNPDKINNPQVWATWIIGHIARITQIDKKLIQLDRNFPIDYDSGFKIRVQKIEMIENVFFKGFTIERKDKGLGHNFLFYYASNSSIECVNSKMTTRSHVRLEKSRNCHIYGNSFEEAHFHCGGGMGYGVNCLDHTSECLIENNIFTGLRHAMMVKEGAHNNVFLNNFSHEPKASPGHISEGGCGEPKWQLPDISIHGHYPYNNLFEHNLVLSIKVDNVWGKAGPQNTFFRNSATNYLEIQSGSDEQILIGNIIKSEIILNENLESTLQIANRSVSGFDNLSGNLSQSLILEKKPEYFQKMAWPSLDINQEDYLALPARERVLDKKIFNKYCCGNISGLNSVIHNLEDFLIFFENNALYIEYHENIRVNIELLDQNGKYFFNENGVAINQPIQLLSNINRGMYILKIYNDSINHTFKIYKP